MAQLYNPAVALEFFKVAGKPEKVVPGQAFFSETDCQLLPINHTAFLLLVKTSPEFAESLLGSLAERLRILTARLK